MKGVNNCTLQSEAQERRMEWLDQREHVLQRPDMYVGAIEPVQVGGLVVYEKQDDEMKEKDEEYCPGGKRRGRNGECGVKWVSARVSPALLHMIKEAVVNAIDNQVRDQNQRNIVLKIERETGVIEVSNDGATVPIVEFKDTKRMTPEIVFSELLSGSNFADDVSSYVGGRFGIGIKAVNILSKWMEIEIINTEYQKHYKQRFEKNMSVRLPPTIKSLKNRKSSLTVVRWLPDYARIGMGAPDGEERSSSPLVGKDQDALVELMSAIAYDTCACVRPEVNVSFNNHKIRLRGIQQYTKAFGVDGALAFDSVMLSSMPVLQVCVAARVSSSSGDGRMVDGDVDDERVIAFVNGMRCSKGTHVDLVVRKVSEVIASKVASTRGLGGSAGVIKPSFVRKHAVIVISTMIPNPRFTSQTKEVLDTPARQWGFTWDPSSSFKSSVERSPLISHAVSYVRETETKALERTSAKAASASSRNGIPRIDKYDPATELYKRKDCELLVTEGDSAKALAVAGLSVVGRARYGVFPLRGKLLNVAAFPAAKALANKEIANLTSILGLKYGKAYDKNDGAAEALPYRHLVVFSDQDHDGAHIAGLVINFIHAHHRSLLVKWPDFVKRFATPIVRITLSKEQQLSFFSLQEHRKWVDANPNVKVLKQRYYKGLGTSTNQDAKTYFSKWDQHITKVEYTGDSCTSAVQVFFDKHLANERKRFLESEYDSNAFVDYSQASTTVKDFLLNEMSHFSFADNLRSLPALDGLKPVQRKVFHTLFEKNIVSYDVKVAQLAATVAEFTAYHHGETSITKTIVGLAQSFVGANNVALLHPEGQFGWRHSKASEHAAPRYIFTRLDEIALKIFRKEDSPVLEYLEDDGKKIEPTHFVPIIPMVLVNGATGIGTGWSTSLPCYNPVEITDGCIDIAKALFASSDESHDSVISQRAATVSGNLIPWYDGFMGSVERVATGVVPPEEADATRLPATTEVGNEFELKGVFEVRGNSLHVTELPPGLNTDSFKSFVIEKLADSVRSVKDISTTNRVHIIIETNSPPVARFWEACLTQKVSTRNVHLFGMDSKLRPYEIKNIFIDHAIARVDLYNKRRTHLIAKYEKDLKIATNRERFVRDVVSGALRIHTVSMADLRERILPNAGFDALPDYTYLLDMRMSSMTLDQADALNSTSVACEEKLRLAKQATAPQMWLSELEELKLALPQYFERKHSIMMLDDGRDAGQSDAGKKIKEPSKKREYKKRGGSSSDGAPLEHKRSRVTID